MDIATLGLAIDSRQTVSAASNLNKMTAAGEKAERQFGGVERGAGRAASSISTVDRAALSVGRSLVRVGATLAVAFGSSIPIRFADAWSDMQSRVGAAIKDMEAAPEMMRRIVDIANASYSPLAQTVEIYGRNVSVLRDLGKSATDAANFTEALNHALVITATKGERAESVQNALSKAMAVGKLQGDGLETVLANGGRVAEVLASKLGTGVNGLRSMASQGKITSGVIADSLIGSLEDLRKEAGEMPATVGDAFTRLQTNITEMIGRVDKASGASSSLAETILSFADGIRTAGDYIIAFGHYAAPVFDAVGGAISSVSQYADIAAVALAGFYAPALLGGVGLLTKALAGGLLAAIKAVSAAMLANPIGLIVAALAAAGYAAYKFRDDIKQAIGIDVVEMAKTGANYVIGSFVAAYEDIKFVWGNFGDMMGGAVIGGVNLAIRAINSLIQKAAEGIDGLIDLVRKIPGMGDTAKIGEAFGINTIDNPYADRLAGAVTERNKAIADALSKDYLGAAFDGFSLPGAGSTGAGGAGDGGGNGGNGQNSAYTDLIKSMREQLALIGQETEAERQLAMIQSGRYGDLLGWQKDTVLGLAKQIDEANKQIEIEKALRDAQSERGLAERKFFREIEAFGRGDQYRGLLDALSQIEERYQRIMEGRRNSPGGLSEVERSIWEQQRDEEMSRERDRYAQRLDMQHEWQFGALRGLENFHDQANNLAASTEEVFSNAFRGMTDALTDFVMTGKSDFSDFANSVIRDMVRIMIQSQITGPLAGALGSALGGLFGGPSGGTPMVSTPYGDIGTGGWFKYDTGGYTGPGGKYEPAGIVHRGEYVLNQDATRRIGVSTLDRLNRGYAAGGLVGGPSVPAMAGGAPNITVNLTNQGTPQQIQGTPQVRMDDMGNMVLDLVVDDIGRHGRVARAFEGRYGLRS